MPIGNRGPDFSDKNRKDPGTLLVVQWLRLHPSYAADAGSVPGWGARIPCAVWHGQKIKEWQGSLSHVKLSVLHSHAQQIVMLIKMRLLPGSYGSHLHQCLFQTTCLSSVHI